MPQQRKRNPSGSESHIASLRELYENCEEQMVNRDNCHNVKTIRDQMDTLFDEIERDHRSRIRTSTTRVKSKLRKELDHYREHHDEVQCRIQRWLDCEEKPSESASSANCDGGNSVDKRLTASHKRQIALLRIKQIEKAQALKRKEQDLAFEKEKLEVQSQLESAALEESLLESSVVTHGDAHRIEPQENSHIDATSRISSHETIADGSVTSVDNQGLSTADQDEPAAKQRCLDQPKDQNADTMYKLANILQEGFNLPKPELLNFNGHTLDYCKFISNFVTNIESKVDDPRLKLSYLIQYCTGEARRSIEDCVLLEPNEGYLRARRILHDSFGRPHNVARAYIERLLNGPKIASGDKDGLISLSRDMEKCEITLSKMGFNSDINNSANLRRIVSRLPFAIKGRWAEKADSLFQNEGREPIFTDLSKFIKERARVASSMYGEDLF